MPEICLVVSKYGKSVYNMRATVAPRAGGRQLQVSASASVAASGPASRSPARLGDDSDIET